MPRCTAIVSSNYPTMTRLAAVIVAAAVGSAEAASQPKGFAGNGKTLKEFGWDAHTHGKIGECKGDCDSDTQCATGLKCFHRHTPGTVTGCAGRSVDAYDYCYDPRKTLSN